MWQRGAQWYGSAVDHIRSSLNVEREFGENLENDVLLKRHNKNLQIAH